MICENRTPNIHTSTVCQLRQKIEADHERPQEKCINTCRARYRDCRSLKQISPYECWGVYQDCTRFTCNAGPG